LNPLAKRACFSQVSAISWAEGLKVRDRDAPANGTKWETNKWEYASTCCTLLIIVVMNKAYLAISGILTGWENHRTATECADTTIM
jgi:hypothetical protein